MIRSFLLVIAGLLAGCSLNQPERETPLGPAEPEEKIVDVYRQALAGNSLLTAEPGDYVVYESNYRIETGPISIRRVFRRELIHRESTDTTLIFAFRDTRTDVLPGGETSTVVTEEIVEVSTADPETAPLEALSESGKDITLTYHNLKVETLRMDPPKLVQEDERCGGLNPCLLRTTKVDYDMAVWEGNQRQQTLHLHRVFSPQIPYLLTSDLGLPVVDECLRQFIKTPDRTYFLTECFVLRDFNWVPRPGNLAEPVSKSSTEFPRFNPIFLLQKFSPLLD